MTPAVFLVFLEESVVIHGNSSKTFQFITYITILILSSTDIVLNINLKTEVQQVCINASFDIIIVALGKGMVTEKEKIFGIRNLMSADIGWMAETISSL